MTTPSNKESWIERFDITFSLAGMPSDLLDEVRDFIRKELSQQHQEQHCYKCKKHIIVGYPVLCNPCVQRGKDTVRQEVVGVIEKMLWKSRLIAYSGPHIMAGSEQERAYLEIYNQAIQDCLAHINQLKEKGV